MKGQRDLTERYTRNATAYRDLWAPVLRPLGRRLIDKLSHVSARRVLDVGAGVGSLLADLARAFPQATVLGREVHRVLRSRGVVGTVTWGGEFESKADRAWAMELDAREHFVDLKTRLGRQKLRLDSLDDETRAECVEAAVARVSRLLPEDFVSRGTVVFATGRAI